MTKQPKVRWRPMKNAPKDQHILLRYPSFGDDGKTYVNQGRWVDVPHTNMLYTKPLWESKPIIPNGFEGHWEIAYVAIMQHGGAWDGYTYEAKQTKVEPTGWLPLPKA